MEILGKSVLVLPDELEKTTTGGIHIPESAKNKSLKGKVITAGSGCKMVRKGDMVYYNKSSASSIELEGKMYHLINEDGDSIFYVE